MGPCLSSFLKDGPFSELLGRPDAELEAAENSDESSNSLPGNPTLRENLSWDQLMELRYRASGAFCAVWLARLDGEAVAVKVLKEEELQNEVARKDLEAEAAVLPHLLHRNVIRPIGTGEVDGRPFIVMEALSGTLADQLPKPFPDEGTICAYYAAVRRWPLRRALMCGLQLAQAMRFLHHSAMNGGRVLHRDLKPDNVGFTKSGRPVRWGSSGGAVRRNSLTRRWGREVAR